MNNNQSMYTQQPPSNLTPGEEKLFAVMGCFGILFIVPLFAGKGSKLCRHYANFGLVCLIFTYIFAFVFLISMLMFPSIIVFGSYLLIWLAILIARIVAIVFAAKGKFIEVPLLTAFKPFK